MTWEEEIDQQIREHLDATDVSSWCSNLIAHWSTVVLVHGPTNQNEDHVLRTFKNCQGRKPTPVEAAKEHLRLICSDLFNGAKRGLGAQTLDGITFEHCELVVKPTASGETFYDNTFYEWTVDGSVQIDGVARLRANAVRATSLFVSHPFHQYRAIPVAVEAERARRRKREREASDSAEE